MWFQKQSGVGGALPPTRHLMDNPIARIVRPETRERCFEAVGDFGRAYFDDAMTRRVADRLDAALFGRWRMERATEELRARWHLT